MLSQYLVVSDFITPSHEFASDSKWANVKWNPWYYLKMTCPSWGIEPGSCILKAFVESPNLNGNKELIIIIGIT